MEDYRKDPQFLFYGKMSKGTDNSERIVTSCLPRNKSSLNTKKELFSKPKAEIGPVLLETPLSKKSKVLFLFSVIFLHIHLCRQLRPPYPKVKKFFPVLSNILHIHLCRQFNMYYVLIPCILFAIKQRK